MPATWRGAAAASRSCSAIPTATRTAATSPPTGGCTPPSALWRNCAGSAAYCWSCFTGAGGASGGAAGRPAGPSSPSRRRRCAARSRSRSRGRLSPTATATPRSPAATCTRCCTRRCWQPGAGRRWRSGRPGRRRWTPWRRKASAPTALWSTRRPASWITGGRPRRSSNSRTCPSPPARCGGRRPAALRPSGLSPGCSPGCRAGRSSPAGTVSARR